MREMDSCGLAKREAKGITGLNSSMQSEGAWRVSPGRVHLFGVPIDRVDRQSAFEIVDRWMESSRSPKAIFTPDTTALMRARWDKSLCSVYQSADLVTADGMGLVLATRIFGTPLAERVAGIDLMERICGSAAQRGKRVYLLGARPGIAEEAARALVAKYPSLRICGASHGYFTADQNEEIIDRIKAAAPDILFAAMGVPLQERWIERYRDMLNVPILMGVGGSFDVLAGSLQRAPLSWQNAGFEWLWRVIQEPWRWKRLKALPAFVIQLLFYRMAGWIFG